jgi:hypothetical protein
MEKNENFVVDNQFFHQQLAKMLSSLNQFQFKEYQEISIRRSLFYKFIDHVNLKAFYTERPNLWKYSIIVNNLIQTHFTELSSRIIEETSDFFNPKIPYLNKASQIFGQIKMDSNPPS